MSLLEVGVSNRVDFQMALSIVSRNRQGFLVSE